MAVRADGESGRSPGRARPVRARSSQAPARLQTEVFRAASALAAVNSELAPRAGSRRSAAASAATSEDDARRSTEQRMVRRGDDERRSRPMPERDESTKGGGEKMDYLSWPRQKCFGACGACAGYCRSLV